MSPRLRIWLGSATAGVCMVGLAAYLVSVGLDKAEKIGSAAGLLVAVAGLVVAVMSYRTDRAQRSDRQAESPVRVHNQISGSYVGGSVVQGRDITHPISFEGSVAPASDDDEQPSP